MDENFQRLFSYDDWANREVLESVRTAGSPRRPLELFAHILSSERLWLERLQRQQQTFPVWPNFNLLDCERQTTELPGLWKSYLAGMNMNDPVTYRNTKGETWTSRAGDVLTHVIMHSAYHRGQIATAMREAGFVPAYTDFIHSVRQGFIP